MIKTSRGSAPRKYATLTLFIVCLPATVLAEKSQIRGWYVGAGYALTNVFAAEEGFMSGTSERGSSDSGFIINGGYRFNRYLAAELSYVYGGEPTFDSTLLLDTDDSTELVDVSVSQKLGAFEASGLIIVPFWRYWEFYSKLGAAYWWAESKQLIKAEGAEPVTRKVNDSDVDFMLAIGFGVTPWKNLHLRLEVQAFRTNDELLALDVDTRSDLEARFDAFILEAQWRFGDQWQQ